MVVVHLGLGEAPALVAFLAEAGSRAKPALWWYVSK